MTESAQTPLTRLRQSLAAMAEKAYNDRDASATSSARSYAAGMGHAYSIAEYEIRKAEKERPTF